MPRRTGKHKHAQVLKELKRAGPEGVAVSTSRAEQQPVREEAGEVDTDRDTSGCQVEGGKNKINKRQRPPPFRT